MCGLTNRNPSLSNVWMGSSSSIVSNRELFNNHSRLLVPADRKRSALLRRREATERPATVVPGHGEPGKVELVQEVQDLLIFVREEVNRRIKEGQTLDLIDQEAAMIIKERYQDWGNDLWIPFEIRNVYAELTGTPLKLPVL
jgi:hypothetical protein